MKKQTYAKGEIVFNQGDVSNQIYQLVSGSIDLIQNYGTDNSIFLLTKGSGSFFGENAGLLSEPRSATAVTSSDCALLLYEPEELIGKGSENFEFIHMVELMIVDEMQVLVDRYIAADLPQLYRSGKAKNDRKEAFEQYPEQYVAYMKLELKSFKRFILSTLKSHEKSLKL